MKVLVIGRGSVGSALVRILCLYHDVDTYDIAYESKAYQFAYDIIHITIPFIDYRQYLKAIEEILKKFKAPIIIVHSTIVCGIMTALIKMYSQNTWYYSPVRCREKEMDKEIQKLDFLIAPTPTKELSKYLHDVGLYWIAFENPEELVMAKLLEVTWFGMNLAFVQQTKLICEDQHLNFDQVYTRYNLYSRIGKDYSEKKIRYMPRPLFVPGFVGGKCVIQDVELMRLMDYGDKRLWDWIIDTNEKFRGK